VRKIVVHVMLSVSYELMEAFSPTADQNPDFPPVMGEFAGIWRAVPKIVFSRTLREVGPNASLRAEVDLEEIHLLQQQPGGDMTLGGVDLVETFRRLDLVDEYRLYVDPVVVGRGRRLFETIDAPTDLELVENRRFGNGVALPRYAGRRPYLPTSSGPGETRGASGSTWPRCARSSCGPAGAWRIRPRPLGRPPARGWHRALRLRPLRPVARWGRRSRS
jgi:dihydrofolate reductase